MKSSRTIIFQRIELKYYVSRSIRTALEKDLQAFIQPDAYTAKTGGYHIRSIYYDTPDMMTYHEKLSGNAKRHKLRVRVYGEDPTTTPFVRLEVKSRVNSTIHKTTVDVPNEDYPAVEDALHNHRALPEKFMHNKDVSQEFMRLKKQYNMIPQVLVQYQRKAYEKKGANRVRLTFDYALAGSRNLDLLGPLKGGREILRYGTSIFEIKVDGIMPFWLHKLICKYDLQNQAISKYCNCLRAFGHLSLRARENDLAY